MDFIGFPVFLIKIVFQGHNCPPYSTFMLVFSIGLFPCCTGGSFQFISSVRQINKKATIKKTRNEEAYQRQMKFSKEGHVPRSGKQRVSQREYAFLLPIVVRMSLMKTN